MKRTGYSADGWAGLFRMTLAALAVAMLSSATAKADLFVGSRVSPASSGVTATDGWDDGGFKIAWDITKVGSDWSYQYTISNSLGGALSKGLSHLILSVSSNFTAKDISNLTGGTLASGDPQTYTPGSMGNSDPNLPGPIYGIKITPTSSSGPYTFSFLSDRAPTWGDFYAKDGVDGEGRSKVDVTAWNTGFGTTPPTDPKADFTAWIARPDTVTNLVPEPSTLAIAGLGALGLLGYALRRRLAN
jgi:hypothetical protein